MAGVMGMDPSLNGHHTGMAAAQPSHLPVSHAAWDSLPSAGPKFSTHPAAVEMNYDSPSHDQLHLHQLHAPFSDYSPHLDGSPHTSLPSYLSHTQPCEPLLAGPRGPGLLDATSQRDLVPTSVTTAAASVSACGGLAGGALFSGLAIGRPGWRGRLALAVRRAAASTAAQLPPLGTTVKLAVVLVVLVVALMGVQRLLSDPATLQVGIRRKGTGEQGQNSRVGAAVGADARAAAAVVSRDNLGGHRGRDKAGANIDGLGVNPSDGGAAAAVSSCDTSGGHWKDVEGGAGTEFEDWQWWCRPVCSGCCLTP